MSITIFISEENEAKIRRLASETGQEVEKVVSDLLNEVIDQRLPSAEENANDKQFKNPFEPFIGMFSSGKTDTSERMSEILYSEELNPAQGFGTDK